MPCSVSVPRMKPTGIVTQSLLDTLRQDFALDRYGYHGVRHWGRLRSNGLRLAGETGANARVVELCAVFHDSRRLNEGHDPDHGLRGAENAARLHGRFYELDDAELELLRQACNGHSDGLTEDEDGEPLNIGCKSRAIPPAMHRALRSRDQGCRFPGCTHKHTVGAHHIQPWSEGGETKAHGCASAAEHTDVRERPRHTDVPVPRGTRMCESGQGTRTWCNCVEPITAWCTKAVSDLMSTTVSSCSP